jgi:hypothetical protein
MRSPLVHVWFSATPVAIPVRIGGGREAQGQMPAGKKAPEIYAAALHSLKQINDMAFARLSQRRVQKYFSGFTAIVCQPGDA